MQGQLRQAIFDSITEQDVAEMVRSRSRKAKSGDDKALQFVMKYVLGFGQPVTLQQINVMGRRDRGADRQAELISRRKRAHL